MLVKSILLKADGTVPVYIFIIFSVCACVEQNLSLVELRYNKMERIFLYFNVVSTFFMLVFMFPNTVYSQGGNMYPFFSTIIILTSE